MALYESIPREIKEIPEHLKTQEMCIEAVRIKPYSLAHVPAHFKTQETYDEVVFHNPYTLRFALISVRRRRCASR